MKKTPLKTKISIHRNDTVRVLRGKDRGKKGRVLAVLSAEGRVLVEGMNQVKKHVRPKRAGEKGQRVVVASPLHLSAVQLVCSSCGKSTRVGHRRADDGNVERICKHCQEAIAIKR